MDQNSEDMSLEDNRRDLLNQFLQLGFAKRTRPPIPPNHCPHGPGCPHGPATPATPGGRPARPALHLIIPPHPSHRVPLVHGSGPGATNTGGGGHGSPGAHYSPGSPSHPVAPGHSTFFANPGSPNYSPFSGSAHSSIPSSHSGSSSHSSSSSGSTSPGGASGRRNSFPGAGGHSHSSHHVGPTVR